eukprot:scpid101383/ scgid11122/ Zinc finger MYM-type protein 1
MVLVDLRSKQRDVVLCHTCASAVLAKKRLPKRGDTAFVSSGFCNWKDATVGFKNHETSSHHRDAVKMLLVLPATTPDVGEMLSGAHAKQKEENRKCFLKIVSNLQFLARQGLALHGDGSEEDSNFMQVLKLRGQDDPRGKTWLEKKTNKYVSHDMQNELLQVMALSVLREISSRIRNAHFFTVMAVIWL